MQHFLFAPFYVYLAQFANIERKGQTHNHQKTFLPICCKLSLLNLIQDISDQNWSWGFQKKMGKIMGGGKSSKIPNMMKMYQSLFQGELLGISMRHLRNHVFAVWFILVSQLVGPIIWDRVKKIANFSGCFPFVCMYILGWRWQNSWVLVLT